MNDRSFEIILYKLTANVVEKIMQLNGWPEDVAIQRFVESKVYAYLEKEETKV